MVTVPFHDAPDFLWRLVGMVLALVLPALVVLIAYRARRSVLAPPPSSAPPTAMTPLEEEGPETEGGGPKTEEAPAEEVTLAAEPSDVDDAPAQLARLGQLLEEGLISEEVYQAKRKEILKKL